MENLTYKALVNNLPLLPSNTITLPSLPSSTPFSMTTVNTVTTFPSQHSGSLLLLGAVMETGVSFLCRQHCSLSVTAH